MRKAGRKGYNERKYQVLWYARSKGGEGLVAHELMIAYGITYDLAHRKLRENKGWGYLRRMNPKQRRPARYMITRRGLEWLDAKEAGKF